MPLEEEAERRGGRLPDDVDRRGQARGDRGRARRRAARPRARRPGLDPARVGAGRGAVRPDHERDPLARAASLQRLGPRQPGADRPLPAPGASGRAQGRLRGHRARRRLRPLGDRRRPPSATDAGFRLNAEKWFVTGGDVAAVYVVMANVIDGDERLPTLFVVDRERPGVEIVDDPALHPQLPGGPPDDPLPRRRGLRRRRDRRRRRRRRAPALLVHGGAARHRGPLRGRDVAAARRDRRLDRRLASRVARGSTTTRESPSRSPTRLPTPPPAAC